MIYGLDKVHLNASDLRTQTLFKGFNRIAILFMHISCNVLNPEIVFSFLPSSAYPFAEKLSCYICMIYTLSACKRNHVTRDGPITCYFSFFLGCYLCLVSCTQFHVELLRTVGAIVLFVLLLPFSLDGT